MLCVLTGMAQVSDGGKEKAPDRKSDPEPNAIGVPSAELSLGWMLASRANLRFTRRDGDTAKVSSKQGQPRVAGQEARQSVAKECSFFVQRMGSTSLPLLAQGRTPMKRGLKPKRRRGTHSVLL